MERVFERYCNINCKQSCDEHDVKQVENLVFVCIDDSGNAYRAFEWFSRNYYRQDHMIGIVHVYSPPCKHPEVNYTTRLYDAIQKSAALVKRYYDLCEHNGMKARIISRQKVESVGHTICELVKEHDPMSVVTGQRGLGVVERTFYGSVSDYLLHHAHVPVLVVPALKNTDKKKKWK